MSYSPRQQHCLKVMGLVAWTSLPAPVDLEISFRDNDSVSLAEWLEKQPLVTFAHRGKSVSWIGSEQATLAVVCMHEEGLHDMQAATLPLPTDCAQLLDLMMRAIELPKNAIMQCVVNSSADLSTDHQPGSQTLEKVVTPMIRGILVLDIRDNWPDTPINTETSLMPVSSLPVWRIPHPQLLLTNPSLKRRAWETLKDLKRAYHG